ASRPREPSRDAGQRDLAQVRRRREGMRLDAVGDLCGRAKHPLVDRGEVDRDARVIDRSRIEERRHEVEVIEVALEREAMLVLEGAPDVAERGHVLLDALRRSVVRHGEAALDVRADLRAEPEIETAAARLLDGPGVHRGDHWAARERDGDPGPEA